MVPGDKSDESHSSHVSSAASMTSRSLLRSALSIECSRSFAHRSWSRVVRKATTSVSAQTGRSEPVKENSVGLPARSPTVSAIVTC